ncbi:MAG: hypothetical protein RR235_08255 [Oscillospiraceae bacterium]
MYKITHNGNVGYRDSFESAEETVKERLKAKRNGSSLILSSYCDVNTSGYTRIVMAYYTSEDDAYDLVVIEGVKEGAK